MPRLSAWAIKAALLYLLLGFTIGALLLANKGQPFWPGIWQLMPAHVEFLVLGWTGQLALGAAYWILPRYPGGSRGNEKLAAGALILLNAGVLLAALQGLGASLWIAGRLCQLGAGLLFAGHAWGRIRPLYEGQKK